MMIEGSLTAIAPLLLRKLLISIFTFADNFLRILEERYKLLRLFRCLIVSSFLFFLRLLPLVFSSLIPQEGYFYLSEQNPPLKTDNFVPATGNGGGGSSGIERAISQLLSSMRDIPVSSRKYEVVRSLAEKIIDENLTEDNKALREINRVVLSVAFSRTLGRFEAAVRELDRCDGHGDGGGSVSDDVIEEKRKKEFYGLKSVLKAVRYCSGVVWRSGGRSKAMLSRSRTFGQKYGAELLWLARKLAACGCVDVAVSIWASASNLAWLGISAEPALQAPLVKVSAFLLKQLNEVQKERNEKEWRREEQRQRKMKMLMSWLPFLCRASNGIDEPVLNATEKAQMEKILENTIDTLEQAEDQEKVLSLWLHHFTHCSSSDWPNLHASYTHWCNLSRNLFLLKHS